MRVISDATHAEQIAAGGAEYRSYQYAPQRDGTARHDNRQESEMTQVLREVFLNPTHCDERTALRIQLRITRIERVLWTMPVSAAR